MPGNFWLSKEHDILAFGLHAMLLYFGIKFHTPYMWRWVLLAMAGVSVLVWIYGYHRMFTINSMATSKIGTAAQGYVEIFGRISSDPKNWVTSPVTSMACVWYRYFIQEETDNGWQTIDSGESSLTFEIQDNTGTCTIDPEGAELIGCDKSVKSESGRRVTEYRLTKNVYALGELSTLGGEYHGLDVKSDVNKLLSEWKSDKKQLLARFDKNGDGEIDLVEWEAARKAALDEVRKQHADIRQNTPVINIIRKPHDNRPFILSSQNPDSLHRKLRWQGFLHLVVAFIAGFIALNIR